MGYFLGIDVRASRTVAAVARPGSPDIETVGLGDDDDVGVASVLHLGADGALSVGAAAERWALTEPDRVVRGFPGRIGDDEAMLLAGEPWAPEELTAWLVRWVVDRVAGGEDAPAARVAVAHPASWDARRTELLAAAVAEQDLEVTFLALDGDAAAADPERDGEEAAPDAAARAAAAALLATAGSGAHPVVDPAESTEAAGSGSHPLVGVAAAAGEPASDQADPPATTTHDSPETDADDPSHDSGQDDPGHGPTAPDEPGSTDAPSGRSWDVPSPRSPESSGPADPSTAHLVADLVGFTGGMGAMNTAGLLSGYTPPHGLLASWPGGHTEGAGTATATGTGVALPAQRSDSGRWSAVAVADEAAPLPEWEETARPARLRARNNPPVLVGVGGVAAAVAVIGSLLLWPAPRTTNSATSRPAPVVPALTAPSAPASSTATEAPTVEPTPTAHARPAAPRTRRPVVVPVPETVPVAETTLPPSESSEPTEPPSTTPPPSTEETQPPPSTEAEQG